jgi:hypothetical protein
MMTTEVIDTTEADQEWVDTQLGESLVGVGSGKGIATASDGIRTSLLWLIEPKTLASGLVASQVGMITATEIPLEDWVSTENAVDSHRKIFHELGVDIFWAEWHPLNLRADKSARMIDDALGYVEGGLAGVTEQGYHIVKYTKAEFERIYP